MNNNIKSLLIFAVGAGIGALITNIIMKEKYEAIVQEELESIRESYEREFYEGEIGEVFSNEEKGLVLSSDRYKKIARSYDTCSIIAGSDGEIVDEIIGSDSIHAPYIISLEEFSEGGEIFDKISIYYYSEDGVLVDDNKEVVVDVDEMIGNDTLSCFVDNFSEVVYVRNERFNIDYEVILLEENYSESVLGFKKEKGKRRRDIIVD